MTFAFWAKQILPAIDDYYSSIGHTVNISYELLHCCINCFLIYSLSHAKRAKIITDTGFKET